MQFSNRVFVVSPFGPNPIAQTFENIYFMAGKATQWLRALVAFSENLSMMYSTNSNSSYRTCALTYPNTKTQLKIKDILKKKEKCIFLNSVFNKPLLCSVSSGHGSS